MNVEPARSVAPRTDVVAATSAASLEAGLATALLRGLWSLPSLAVLGLVRVYQITLSPMLGPSCRFHPSCSHYACACLRDHGLVWGGALTVRRIVRCQPFHPGGFDPPPPPRVRALWTRWVLGASSVQHRSPDAAPAEAQDRPAASTREEPVLTSTRGSNPRPLEPSAATVPAQPPVPRVLAPHDLLRGAP